VLFFCVRAKKMERQRKRQRLSESSAIPHVSQLVTYDEMTEKLPNGSTKLTIKPSDPKLASRLLFGRTYPTPQPLPQENHDLHLMSAYMLTYAVIHKLESLEKKKKKKKKSSDNNGEECELEFPNFPKAAIESMFDLLDLNKNSHRDNNFVYDKTAGIVSFWLNQEIYSSLKVQTTTPEWRIRIRSPPTHTYTLATEMLMVTVEYEWVR
jgi:hypothetical protein